MISRIALFYSRLTVFIMAVLVLFSFLIKGIILHSCSKIKEIRDGN